MLQTGRDRGGTREETGQGGEADGGRYHEEQSACLMIRSYA